MTIYYGKHLHTGECFIIATRDCDPRPVSIAWYQDLSWFTLGAEDGRLAAEGTDISE